MLYHYIRLCSVYSILFYYILLYYILVCHIVSYFITSYHSMLYYIISYCSRPQAGLAGEGPAGAHPVSALKATAEAPDRRSVYSCVHLRNHVVIQLFLIRSRTIIDIIGSQSRGLLDTACMHAHHVLSCMMRACVLACISPVYRVRTVTCRPLAQSPDQHPHRR